MRSKCQEVGARGREAVCNPILGKGNCEESKLAGKKQLHTTLVQNLSMKPEVCKFLLHFAEQELIQVMSVLWNDLELASQAIPNLTGRVKSCPIYSTGPLSFPSEPTPLARRIRAARRAENLPEES